MLALLDDLGLDIQQHGHTITLCAAGLHKTELNAALCSKVRSSILLAGPLVARHGKATLHPPGGDIIGRRRLDTHFLALRALGTKVSGSRVFSLERKVLKGTNMMKNDFIN